MSAIQRQIEQIPATIAHGHLVYVKHYRGRLIPAAIINGHHHVFYNHGFDCAEGALRAGAVAVEMVVKLAGYLQKDPEYCDKAWKQWHSHNGNYDPVEG